MKKGILVLAAAFGSYFVQAQVSFGGQAGVLSSSAKQTYDGKEEGDKKSIIGFRIGAFAEMPISGGIFFNPALNFVSKGGKYSSSTTANGITNKSESSETTSYLEIPLNFTYKLDAENGGVFFGAGPVLGFGIGGKAKFSSSTTGNVLGNPINQSSSGSVKVKFDGKKNATDSDAHLKALEFGANIFVGYEMSNGIRAQLSFNPNFSNLSPEDKTSYKNTTIGLTIGYKFGGSKK
jgi:hypothetical protein